VRHCHQLPGQPLFQYLDEAGEPHPIDSDQVNAYLKESMGDDFTAKDFRTWTATLRAIQIMRGMPLPERSSERALASCIVEAVKRVAAELRNTPAVCRKSYINPIVFDAWRCGALHTGISEEIIRAPRRAERLVAAFLRREAARAVLNGAKRGKRARPLPATARRLPLARHGGAHVASPSS
jgi:DNA topoisomerase IB